MTIDPDKIGAVIGTGGKTIRSIIAETKTTIDISNDGTVLIGSSDAEAAQKAMTALKPRVFKPNAKAHTVYEKLYALYRNLHDALGTPGWNGNLYHVMKDLLAIRAEARK